MRLRMRLRCSRRTAPGPNRPGILLGLMRGGPARYSRSHPVAGSARCDARAGSLPTRWACAMLRAVGLACSRGRAWRRAWSERNA
jgi:hypothetical protein